MATTFKTFINSDVTSTRTLLHESIPITGSIASGTYYIADVSELDAIDYTKVMQAGKSALRYNVAGDKAILKWEGDKPSFIDGRKTMYTHSEMLAHLSNADNGWVSDE